jgi:hypothetical protein
LLKSNRFEGVRLQPRRKLNPITPALAAEGMLCGEMTFEEHHLKAVSNR